MVGKKSSNDWKKRKKNFQWLEVFPTIGKMKKTHQQRHEGLPANWLSDTIYVMNPGNTNWQTFLAQRERDVHTVFPFDGWHVDQLGDFAKTPLLDILYTEVWPANPRHRRFDALLELIDRGRAASGYQRNMVIAVLLANATIFAAGGGLHG